MRTRDGHVEHLPRKHVGRGRAARNYRRSRAVNARVRTLRAAQPELRDGRAVRRIDDLCGLGRDQRLVVEDAKDRRLDQLRLEKPRFDGEYRLLREDDRPLGHRIDVAGEPQPRKQSEEVLVKQFERAKIGDLLFVEAQTLDVLYHLLKSARDRIIVAHAAVKDVEDRRLVHQVALGITVHHRQLIEVGQKCKISHFLSLLSFVSGAVVRLLASIGAHGCRRHSAFAPWRSLPSP